MSKKINLMLVLTSKKHVHVTVDVHMDIFQDIIYDISKKQHEIFDDMALPAP